MCKTCFELFFTSCLFEFKVDFNLGSCCDRCLFVGVVLEQCAATLESHATYTGHDTLRRHCIQTQGQPVVVLSIDVERHTGIHNYPCLCLGSYPTGEHSSTTFHTHQWTLNFMMLLYSGNRSSEAWHKV